MESCSRPLTKTDCVEMTTDKKWATLEVMGFLKEEKQGGPTDSMAGAVDVATDIPENAEPPPPKAPGGAQTYSEDPTTGIWHYLGDAERKGNDTEGEDDK